MDELKLNMSTLQLSNYPSSKILIDYLFNEWVIQEGSQFICSLTLDAVSPQGSGNAQIPKNGLKVERSTPPRAMANKSPKKRTQAEMMRAVSPTNKSSKSSDFVAATTVDLEGDASEDGGLLRKRANFDKIPVFYIPGSKVTHLSRSIEEDQLSKKLGEIESFFKPFPNGIPVEKFVHVTKRLCGIPSFFNLPLCKRINELFGDAESGIPGPRVVGKVGRQPSGVKIKMQSFLRFWKAEVEPYDRVERLFRVIKHHDADFIYKDDFIPFLQELLHFHPGLDFLEAHEEFQRKYSLTVITRIFYKVNTSRTGKLSLREVRHSNLFNACMHVDEETDINRVVDYFSYEHFYVLYCKFFELDSDKDSTLTRGDLSKYGEHSLSDAIVDR
jgi:serine/threonine-protein phosphatase 2A regulatory subunit B''